MIMMMIMIMMTTMIDFWGIVAIQGKTMWMKVCLMSVLCSHLTLSLPDLWSWPQTEPDLNCLPILLWLSTYQNADSHDLALSERCRNLEIMTMGTSQKTSIREPAYSNPWWGTKTCWNFCSTCNAPPSQLSHNKYSSSGKTRWRGKGWPPAFICGDWEEWGWVAASGLTALPLMVSLKESEFTNIFTMFL